MFKAQDVYATSNSSMLFAKLKSGEYKAFISLDAMIEAFEAIGWSVVELRLLELENKIELNDYLKEKNV